ncbi:hypothetical protein PG985_016373 [Apiospora marii]|uniref:uncharacterized protein n=1 Tax=Apiospora marii TaxID=335849 RepID=UPI003130313C
MSDAFYSKTSKGMATQSCLKKSVICILQCRKQPSEVPADHVGRVNVLQRRRVSSEQFHTDGSHNWRWFCAEASVCIIFASASSIRCCPRCLHTFKEAFGMPELWWTDSCKNSNGYFGCETIQDATSIADLATWAYFETKLLDEQTQYKWLKSNVFAHWKAASKQMAILVFDVQPPYEKQMTELFTSLQTDETADPFWVYVTLASEIVRFQDTAVWAVRDHVRLKEKEGKPEGKPEPDYRRLHDLARHAVHVTETTDVALGTMHAILVHHEAFKTRVHNDRTWQKVHNRLLFFRQMLEGLRCRSNSNEKRLLNEIQLAFHMVVQYDSGTSVDIGKATQEDSAAMKTIATLTLIFLPPTFISTIFSMSFFNVDAETGWKVSNRFWVYWAFAVPMTLLTTGLWYHWQRRFSQTRVHGNQTSPYERRQLLDARHTPGLAIFRRR